LLKRALDKAKQNMKDAEDEGNDDDFLKNAQRCMALGGSDTECKKEKVRQLLLKMCQVKVKAKNLKNFADESVEEVNCETEIVGSAE
jgi:hypothetical protein